MNLNQEKVKIKKRLSRQKAAPKGIGERLIHNSAALFALYRNLS